jgi:D-alanine-D-alanine ligase and related ATP-grasp enzymes
MIIGMTYNLKSYYLTRDYSIEEVAEFDCEETIQSIEDVLEDLGHQVVRIGCLEQLMQRLLNGERWDLVFNIAEGINGIGREAQIPSILDAYKIPYTFSTTEIMAAALDKGLTNAVMRSYGVRTAEFHVVRKLKDVHKIRIPFPLFVKPIAEGTSRGINENSKVNNEQELYDQCKFILDSFHQPALVEEYLPGREFTVGILGTGEDAKALGVLEILMTQHADQSAYTYDNKQQYEQRMVYQLVDEPKVARLALKAWESINCRDAGRVDVRINSKGEPCFMEVNTMAGLNPNYSDLCILCRQVGFPYHDLIEHIVNEAISRGSRLATDRFFASKDEMKHLL